MSKNSFVVIGKQLFWVLVFVQSPTGVIRPCRVQVSVGTVIASSRRWLSFVCQPLLLHWRVRFDRNRVSRVILFDSGSLKLNRKSYVRTEVLCENIGVIARNVMEKLFLFGCLDWLDVVLALFWPNVWFLAPKWYENNPNWRIYLPSS